MSTFSNRASQAPAAAAEYITALLAVLGDKDPVAVQARLLPDLGGLIAGLSDAELRAPEAPGKWSIASVVEHLTDQELINAYRLRSIVAEPDPPLRGYDQDRWAAQLRYGAAPPAEVVEELGGLRRRNLRLYRSLAPEEWERMGHHSERGPESARRLCSLTAAHDLVHLRQVARIRTAIRGAAGRA